MAHRVKGRVREATNSGCSASAAKTDGTPNSSQVGRREPSSFGSTDGRSEDLAGRPDHLHQQIAELAYVLYERSGFQDGKDLEHWLEAERQVKAVRGLAA